eukprot:1564217-Amphidinium_carterae.1
MPTGSAGQPSTSATAPMDMAVVTISRQTTQWVNQHNLSRADTSMADTILLDLQSLMWGSV